MYSQYLDTIFDTSRIANVVPYVAKGSYTLVNKALAELKVMDRSYLSQLEMSSDFQVAVFEPNVWTATASADYDGYNKKVLTSSGRFSSSQAYDEYARSGSAIKIQHDKHYSIDLTAGDRDSQEAFIFNMLVSWFKAEITRDCEPEDLFVRQHSFKDSHVENAMADGGMEGKVEIRLGAPAPERLKNALFVERNDLNFWTKPYVVKYNALTHEQQAFYLAHVMGRTETDGITADISIPGVMVQDFLFEPIGVELTRDIDYSSVDWRASDTMMAWIRDYVELNRCYKAFAAACDLLGTLAFNPAPSFHESIWWNPLVRIVYLAPFTPTRARVPTTLNGEGMYESETILNFFRNDACDMKNFIVMSSLVNYANHMALYGLLMNERQDLTDWKICLSAIIGSMSNMRGPLARAQLFSLITNREVESMTTNNCYLEYDMSDMTGGALTVEFDVLKGDNQAPTAKIINPVPYVSGALFAGACGLDVDGFEHIMPRQTIEIPKSGNLYRDDVFRLAAAYRYFGHELDISAVRDRTRFSHWCNGRELVLAKYPILNAYDEDTKFKVHGSKRRPGRHDDVLEASYLRGGDVVELVISRPQIIMAGYRTRREIPTVASRGVRRAKVLLPKVKGAASSKRVSVRASALREKGDRHESDFPEAQVGQAPSNPILNTSDASILEQLNVDLGQAAENAG
ncbi:capsid protein [Red clover powdery mildew-associated totivirus 3]|uniref:Capsid protein n=1 Tax=Red clover powdery mildew-associated totivirus 3 TaxID=1714364 RepID=A0A0S3Q2B9_9VIRU|nr:capsid protein [Red clover powdery mildew-associated totivirus 3]BAT62481.1 capsid protein [Red clover powdery mildew-associated totivirus 3]